MLSPRIIRVLLVVILASAFVTMLFQRQHADHFQEKPINPNTLYVFYSPFCHHCQDASRFLKNSSLPSCSVEYVDVTSAKGKKQLIQFAGILKLKPNELSVPLFIYKDKYRIGFDSDSTTGKELIAWLNEAVVPEAVLSSISIPGIGEVSLKNVSLPALTVILGLADGFNPCAMWVLIYLISIIMVLRDKAKIWWLVGTFVLASGVIYFLFMTAWLNLFLYIGYIDTVTLLVGFIALGLGINQLYQLIETRGEVICEVGDAALHQSTINRIKYIVSSPVNLASIAAMIVLAFVVNSIEFICSSALPAIYTHTLSLMSVSTVEYYSYISLYVFFFMLDDLIIFSLAAFAVQKLVDTRYAAYSRFIGGIILIILGAWMLGK